MKPQTYFLLFTLLALALCKISYPQNTEVPFALTKFIGDTLNLAERDYYGLYKDFNGFQRAMYFISDDGSTLLTKISYSKEGEAKDTIRKQNIDYKGNLLAFIRRVDVERMDNWEDAREITLTDINGNIYTGIFFDLEKNRLYMTTAQLTDYSQVINNYKIFNKEDVRSILVFGRGSNMWEMVGYGFLGGAAFGALIGFAYGNSKDSRELFSKAEEKALVLGIFFGAVGAVVGLILSPLASTGDETITINADEDFYGLAKFLKNQNINAQISQRNR